MITQASRDPWRIVWQIATSDRLLIVLLLGIAVGLAVTIWLPQTSLVDPTSNAPWISRMQARYGSASGVMQTLGLFTITQTVVFRLLLALLASCLALRLVEAVERWVRDRRLRKPAGVWHTLSSSDLPGALDDLRRRRYRVLGESPVYQVDRWPWANLFAVMAYVGALVVMVGLFVTYLAHLRGWRYEGLVLQEGNRVWLAENRGWVEMEAHSLQVTHSPGVVVTVEEQGPGVLVRAQDDAGQLLPLYQVGWAPPEEDLLIVLSDDQLFSIPDAQLGVRLVPQGGGGAGLDTPILVQVYDSPPGQLKMERVVEGDTELQIDGVTLALLNRPYLQLTAALSPGRWPAALGVVILLVGLLGNLVWPARRFWLRSEETLVQGCGDVPRRKGEGVE